uniref:hypothetical protein n=1 Tax=uncultured Rhizobium sp. TaxID=155567 RepID=UPI002608E8B3|nr:hypothetical protein [uncultured Rhizobium sp.]
MSWGNKQYDWSELVSYLQEEIDANKGIIPADGLRWVQHYLDHDEYSMAFEYLYLALMDIEGSRFTKGKQRAVEIALFLNLNDQNECMIDADFWQKFQNSLARAS